MDHDTSVRTQTKTSISKRGDKIVVKEVVTTTTTRSGQKPEVTVNERVNEYDVNNIPDELKAELGGLLKPDDHKKVTRTSSQGGVQGTSKTVSVPLEKRIPSLPPPKQIDEKELEKLNDDCIKCHNAYRERHGVPPLTFSKELAAYAQNWAEELADNQRFEHRKNGAAGENLFMFYSSDSSVIVSAGQACDSWYSEIKKFQFGKEPRNMDAGHFTQMIWKETKKVGMGRARGPTGKQIIVANYDPPGNLLGTFATNVPKPLQ
ncbi:UNVERIFIED_CONTAM: hypothetical protein PYX00_009113 [Menopon gallinae]|uniref:SCP domain-containing protein n=1 Tax=Menopon gallinae TaxID=328185 RepID=A0AAW2HA91_9NEOP